MRSGTLRVACNALCIIVSTCTGVSDYLPQGPYGSAILRLHISFPDDFPLSPPLLTVLTDIFHPLIVPLTTYTFASGAFEDSSVVKTKEEDRLPPGALCFRHAFPSWFTPRRNEHELEHPRNGSNASASSPGSSSLSPASPDTHQQRKGADKENNLAAVLEYMKAVFENSDLLDNFPLEYVGNPGAWHAWRAYRGLPKWTSRPTSPVSPGRKDIRTPMKHPGDWNWEGVFEARIRNGIEASISEATLFSTTASRPAAVSNDPVGDMLLCCLVTLTSSRFAFRSSMWKLIEMRDRRCWVSIRQATVLCLENV